MSPIAHKTCSSCLLLKELACFPVDRSRRFGRGSWCTECVRGYKKDLHEKHKRFLEELKSGRSCADCFGVFPPVCLEFDHVDGAKRHNIAEMSSWSRETVLEEIAKCELVCANCHRFRTADQQQYTVRVAASVDLPQWKKNKAARQRERIQRFREMLAALKANPCADCLRAFHTAAMDFDHVRGEKRFSIANGWTRPHSEVLVELSKCDLVCANCHRLRTEARSSDIRSAA